ncbi:hypothetical protein [Endozoicomonas elysicola]|uniref:hypothetical protein n=1 Tax=Endozoicomonas elysicola TaxID=305900 RepID=UPI00035D83FD|nr:hypothetical protein [Endozoicomonas elysicola]
MDQFRYNSRFSLVIAVSLWLDLYDLSVQARIDINYCLDTEIVLFLGYCLETILLF